jgi:hypothetical protein
MTSYYEIEVLISELSKNSLKIPKSNQKPISKMDRQHNDKKRQNDKAMLKRTTRKLPLDQHEPH